jgi:hypothetical protein
MKKIIFTSIGLICMQMLLAQVPEVEWTRTYGGSGSESSSRMVENTDGDYFFACSSTSQPSEERTAPRKGSRDIWVVKTDKAGNKIWDKAYGSGQVTVTDMAATPDGGFIVGVNTFDGKGGDKTDTARGNLDIWLVKIDRDGNIVWDKTLGGSEGEGLGEIIVTPDGSILIAGSSNSGISGDKKTGNFGIVDAWLVKLNSNGGYLWDKSFGGSGGDSFYTGLVDKDGNYIFGGTSYSPISGNKTDTSRGGNDGWLVKTDADGNIIWDKTLGGDLIDFIQTMAITKEGDYVLGIITESGISGDKTGERRGVDDCWLVKLDTDGEIIWQKTIGGDKGDQVLSIQIDKDDGMYLGIQTTSGISGEKTIPFVGPGSDIWVIKTNELGDIAWQSSYEFAGLGMAKLTSENSYVLTGVRNAFYLIKLKNAVVSRVADRHLQSQLIVFPNPAIHHLSIQSVELQNNHAIAEIYSIDGKIMYKQAIKFVNGVSEVSFELMNGDYLIKISQDDKIYLQKFFIY